MGKILAIITMAIGFVVMVTGISAVLAIPVLVLWNWLCPVIFGLPTIGFLQAWGLSVLFAFLFKNTTKYRNKTSIG